ncbi:unnamed protein product [Blepharisma stoltei]|uniref:Uncharacterized protein n=1 Tax=Blepharisma stoltei TaxID=1481888 RepID=A0AAU9IZC4_9CILI|nr:unnamed protein product [Blepharisma stoltei]
MKDSVLSLFTLTLESLIIAEIYNYRMRIQSEIPKEKIEDSPISLIPTNILSINSSLSLQTPAKEEFKSSKKSDKTKENSLVESHDGKNEDDFIYITPNMKKFNPHKKHKKIEHLHDDEKMKKRREMVEILNHLESGTKRRKKHI